MKTSMTREAKLNMLQIMEQHGGSKSLPFHPDLLAEAIGATANEANCP